MERLSADRKRGLLPRKRLSGSCLFLSRRRFSALTVTAFFVASGYLFPHLPPPMSSLNCTNPITARMSSGLLPLMVAAQEEGSSKQADVSTTFASVSNEKGVINAEEEEVSGSSASSSPNVASLQEASETPLLLEGASYSRFNGGPGGPRRRRRNGIEPFPLYEDQRYEESSVLSPVNHYDGYERPYPSFEDSYDDSHHYHHPSFPLHQEDYSQHDDNPIYDNNRLPLPSLTPEPLWDDFSTRERGRYGSIYPAPYPHIYPPPHQPRYSEMCCADCPEGNIRCLSRCVRKGCTAATTCSNAGKGAYAAFCSRRCETLAGMSLASSIEFLPKRACAGACAAQVQRLCEIHSCRDFGCYAPDCFELSPLKCSAVH